MNVLMVDDEVGIREGMASFLRLAGHRVRTAETVAAGVTLLEEDDFDVVVTDWHLGDEDASRVVATSPCPCVVVSGHPDEVTQDGCSQVLSKPVFPADLLSLLEDLVQEGGPQPDAIEAFDLAQADLPVDAASRVDLLRSLSGTVEILDDGEFVTAIAPLPNEVVLETLETCGGDLRVLAPDGAARIEWRFYRDGRPDGVRATLGPSDQWPNGSEPVAVDFHDTPCSPDAFCVLLDRVSAARASGREVWLLNVPNHLRLFVDALGRTEELPKRSMAGPRLPDVLTQLWS